MPPLACLWASTPPCRTWHLEHAGGVSLPALRPWPLTDVDLVQCAPRKQNVDRHSGASSSSAVVYRSNLVRAKDHKLRVPCEYAAKEHIELLLALGANRAEATKVGFVWVNGYAVYVCGACLLMATLIQVCLKGLQLLAQTLLQTPG
eukprot:scaffold213969_cov17-Tisochrysis_lutea.AAC.1